VSDSDHRATYLRALDPEGPLPSHTGGVRQIRTALDAVEQEPAELDVLVERARSWGAEQAQRFRDVRAAPDPESALRCVLLNCAPLALSAGAWLQWASSAGNAETEPALRVLSLYASDVGIGYPQADRGSDYRALLRRHRIGEETHGVRLAGSAQIESFSFRLPGLLLAMSRLPEEFLPELLGADLCLRAVGLPPPLALLNADELGVDVRELDLGAGRRGAAETALELSTAAVHAVARVADVRRLRHGFRWAEHELRLWSDRLLGETSLTGHPDYDIWRLICARARQAAVYHADFLLAGRPLAEWFANVDEGPGPFLAALARSPLVRPGKPDRSPLLRGLIGEKGRMFRIFTDDEVAVLRRWIAQLPDEGSVLHADQPASGREELHDAQRSWYRPSGRPDLGGTAVARQRDGFGKPAPRAAYRALLSRADQPGLRRFAHGYATRWLARSRYGLDRAERQLPRRWDPENGLRGWLADEHDRHGEEFADSEVPLPAKEDLVDSTLQLAPLIMIDGGWLQGFTDYQHASSRSGHFLFRTYWDELGNGVSELNHPRIYRELLRDMGIDLPPTDSPEFTAWPGFRDEAFALPVYWLSISRFPRTFQPEILGLNLAMELSGVGGSYRDARLALRHHGFSTQFVDLHNTIDNVSTGHSAWAVDAIDSYLADLPGVVGRGEEPAVWERIRVGYRSLNPPDGLAANLYSALKSRATRDIPAMRS